MPTQLLSALTDTWNNAVTVWYGIKMNVTGVAYAAASRLFSLQLTGSEKFAVTPDGAALVGPGTLALPSMSFIIDPDTGLYRLAANRIGVSAGGDSIAQIDSTGITMSSGRAVLLSTGNATTPSLSFDGDTNTGIFSQATDVIGFSVAGTLRMSVSATALTIAGLQTRFPDGNETAPSIAFENASNTGFFKLSGSAGIGVSTNGTENMRITSSGSVRIGDELTTDNVGTSAAGLVGVTMQPAGLVQMARAAADILILNTQVAGAASTVAVRFRREGAATGNISVTDTAAAYNLTSDYRLKNIEDQPEDYDIWERIEDLDAALTWFSWISSPASGLHFGTLAHVFQEVAPYAVSGEKDAIDPETGEIDPQGVDWSKPMPEVIAGLAAAMREIKALKARVLELESAQ